MPGDTIILHVYQKLWSDDVWFPEICCAADGRTDGWMDRKSDIYRWVPHLKTQKQFNQVEVAGSEITYQCINCGACKRCKNHDQIEMTSIKKEVEQDMINESVSACGP